MGYDINKLNEQELKRELKKSIRNAYDKMERLRKAGYEDYDWNKQFRDVMQSEFRVKTPKAMNRRVDDLSFQKARSILSYVDRHMEGYEASITGVRKMELDSLQLMSRLSTGDGDSWDIQRHRDGNYTVKYDGWKEDITPKQLSDFWSKIRKIDEAHNLQTLKGGSDEGVAMVFEYYFRDKDTKLSSLMERVEDVYTKEQADSIRREEEFEAELERIKNKERFSNR